MGDAVVGAVSEVEASLAAARKLVENELWSCSGAEVADLLPRLHRLRAQVESLELHLVREVAGRGIPQEVGAVNTRAYLVGALVMAPAEAAVTVKLAEALGEQFDRHRVGVGRWPDLSGAGRGDPRRGRGAA